jgi:predicted metal-dependent HD superfamily phosphohydrolase
MNPPARTRFSAAWHALGAADDGARVHDALLWAWAEPHRLYHSTSHLQACLELFDQQRKLAKAPDEVELALARLQRPQSTQGP